jgi:heme-degrading monooxygenase HmoA
MVIVLVRTALRPNADLAAYEALNGRMFEILSKMPGFLGVSGYASPEGEEIGMVRFESLDALKAWREHPEHVVARARGHREFYASLSIEVCQVVRAYDLLTAQATLASA